jgi:hypothetical protein
MAAPLAPADASLKRRTSLFGKFLASFGDDDVAAKTPGDIVIKKQLSVSKRIQRALGFGADASASSSSAAAGDHDRGPPQPPLPAASTAAAALPSWHRIESMAGTIYPARSVFISAATHCSRTCFFVSPCRVRPKQK